MKYLISVGTTSFDSLIKFIDNIDSNHEFLFQIANGKYKPLNYPYFSFVENIFEHYSDYIPIVHCGAGTIYSLLESKRPFISIPNLERKDDHQLDIANYIMENNYALVAKNFNQLESILINDSINKVEFSNYKKEVFFKAEEISTFFIREN